MVDNTAPEIFSHLSIDKIGSQKLEKMEKEIPVYPRHAMLFLAATDKQVGTHKIYYSVDNGPEKEYLGPVKTSRAGLWVVKVRSIDKLGNENINEPIEFVIQ